MLQRGYQGRWTGRSAERTYQVVIGPGGVGVMIPNGSGGKQINIKWDAQSDGSLLIHHEFIQHEGRTTEMAYVMWFTKKDQMDSSEVQVRSYRTSVGSTIYDKVLKAKGFLRLIRMTE